MWHRRNPRKAPVAENIVEALRRLEYPRYDSAGVATLVDGGIERRRAVGKLKNLADLLVKQPLPGTSGIGHTRWAPMAASPRPNAHPHVVDDVVVVHNGIIENFRALKDELTSEGVVFTHPDPTRRWWPSSSPAKSARARRRARRCATCWPASRAPSRWPSCSRARTT